MIVENKAGAGTSIGAAFVSREAPDGYHIDGDQLDAGHQPLPVQGTAL